ncbi:uncharacterized protein [Battus philenor]|uniref:uncharacterized protein n=1 Tax=Battus philenor TaxID=42288 RepID=UPI0035CFFF20
MNGIQLWLVAASLHLVLLTVDCEKHHRRSASQGALPFSKGGWRPVVGSGGLLYGSFGTAPLHAPSYKLPVIDLYPSSARPIATRDAAKLTSIAQSYRPTTLRTVSAAPASPVNQPINSYLNPFSLPNNGLSHFKYVQSYPLDGFVFRNTHNQFAARPQQKPYQSKQKQPAQNSLLQQLTSIQPIHFGQYQTPKPYDLFGKPIDSYGRPIDGGKRQQTVTEIFKPEVYKLPDNTAQPQEVKTAQQQTFAGVHNVNPLANYAFQDSPLPPTILGSFGSFGLQSVKGRDPVYPSTKPAYISPRPTKQTIFNSYSYTSNNFKSTPSLFSPTTPKLQTNKNQYQFGPTANDYRNVPTQQTKVSNPPKIDPNANSKGMFKPSPQDPFVKNFQKLDLNKITTYNPITPTTTLPNSFYFSTQHNIPVKNYQNQQNAQINNYLNQQNQNYNYENEINKKLESFPDNINHHTSQNYNEQTKTQLQETPLSVQQGHYEVTENHNDIITHLSPWTSSPDPYENNEKPSAETIIKHESIEEVFRQPTTTPASEVTEDFVIVTESERGYENSLSYDEHVESQSRRPVENDFEPIERNKLKEYYYKVSTPSYGDHTYARRTKKPTDLPKVVQTEATTSYDVIKDNITPVEALPTLPPNKHFKRPSTPEPLDKDRIRKRNKIRRRRPGFANNNRNKEETTTRRYEPASEPTLTTTVTEEVYTIRPRLRPVKQDQSQTTPAVTTDLTTSALPTISPTAPTIVRKKLGHRRPLTTPVNKVETTTAFREPDTIKESPIMKISTRPQLSKLTSSIYEYQASDVPDYSHKQDEKDTPTSDVSVSLSDSLKSSAEVHKEFLFHRDVKPVEIKETTTEVFKESSEKVFETTTTPHSETTTRTTGKRLRLKNKLDRPKFNVKDYRNRLSSTTSTTEKVIENTPKLRFPQRKAPYVDNSNSDNDNGSVIDRKRFMPKDPRHKQNKTDSNEAIDKEIHSTRQPARQRPASENESTTQKISSRIRNGQRRPRPTEDPVESSTQAIVHNKRLLRKRIKDSETGESVQDITVTENTANIDQKSEITSERTRSESAIMKIADKKHHDPIEHLFEHSKRVSDLTLAASKDYGNPGMFKTVSGNSRRIPNYFTIATDDPILPIEAFFPQLNQKKEP